MLRERERKRERERERERGRERGEIEGEREMGRGERGGRDIIFVLRRIQDKGREQNMGL